MSTATAERFDAAIEIKNVSNMLTATRPAHTRSDRPKTSKMKTAEIVGEVYTVLSLVAIIGVLLYHIVA